MKRARLTVGPRERVARAAVGFGLAPLGLRTTASADSRLLVVAGIVALVVGAAAAVSGVTGVRPERVALRRRGEGRERVGARLLEPTRIP